MSIESMLPSNHLILCHRLLFLPSVLPSINVFSSESALLIRWPKYWSFSISPSSEYSGLISFRIDWFDLLAVQGALKSLLQHHSLKASILWHSAFFIVQLSHLYMRLCDTIRENNFKMMLDILIIQVTPFQGKFHHPFTFFSVSHESPGSSPPAPSSFLWPCDLFSDIPPQEPNPKCCHFTREQGKQLIFLSFSSRQYLHLHRLNQVVLLQEDHSFSGGILSWAWEGAQSGPLQDGGELGCSTKSEALYTGASYLNSLAWCSTSVNKSLILALCFSTLGQWPSAGETGYKILISSILGVTRWGLAAYKPSRRLVPTQGLYLCDRNLCAGASLGAQW